MLGSVPHETIGWNTRKGEALVFMYEVKLGAVPL